MIGHGSLSGLPLLREFKSRRASSYDTTGGNCDWWTVEPKGSVTILESSNPGCIKHIWMTVGNDDEFPRKLVLRAYWDGEPDPSIEVPLGDFFGMGHGKFKNFSSLPLQMSPADGRGMNCWFPMPFDCARLTLENQGDKAVNVYFYVDYEEYAKSTAGLARFHAMWRREACTEGWLTEKLGPENYLRIWQENPNLTDDDNYLILKQLARNGVTESARSYALYRLSKLTAGDVIEFVEPFLLARSSLARRLAVLSLVDRDDEASRKLRMVFLLSPDPETKLIVTEAIKKPNDEEIRKLLWSAVNEPSDAIRLASYIRLTESSDKSAQSEGRAAMHDDSFWVRMEYAKRYSRQDAATHDLAAKDKCPLVREVVKS